MNILILIIASLALLISLAALYFSFFIYRKHDRELEYYSEILNKYENDNTEEEIDDEDEVIVEAEVIDERRNSKII